MEIPKDIMDAWVTTRNKDYAIPDPNDNLIEIYEIDTIKDALMLRAEKWESPEHKLLDQNQTKVPLNVQNPNYTQLLEHIKNLQKASRDLKKNPKDTEKLIIELTKVWDDFMLFVNKIISLMSNQKVDDIKIGKLIIPDIRLL